MNFELLKKSIWYNVCGRSWLSMIKPYSFDKWINQHKLNISILNKNYTFELSKLCIINQEVCEDMEIFKHYKEYLNLYELIILMMLLLGFIFLTLKLPKNASIFMIILIQLYLYSFKDYESNSICIFH